MPIWNSNEYFLKVYFSKVNFGKCNLEREKKFKIVKIFVFKFKVNTKFVYIKQYREIYRSNFHCF